jgi:hypothetical protein
MKPKIIFLFFLFVCFFSNAFCQKKYPALVFKPIQIANFLPQVKKKNEWLGAKKVYTVSKSALVQPSFYCSNLGYFCKQELKLAKATKFKLPIAIRLGSLQYVDYMEGKPNTQYYSR